MKIVDFFECENSNYWLEKISKTDWRSGKYLYELLKSNLFHRKAGSFAKVLLLVDDDLLLSFCTVSEKKYDIESFFAHGLVLFIPFQIIVENIIPSCCCALQKKLYMNMGMKKFIFQQNISDCMKNMAMNFTK